MNFPPGTPTAPVRECVTVYCAECESTFEVEVCEHLGAVDVEPDSCECGEPVDLSTEGR